MKKIFPLFIFVFAGTILFAQHAKQNPPPPPPPPPMDSTYAPVEQEKIGFVTPQIERDAVYHVAKHPPNYTGMDMGSNAQKDSMQVDVAPEFIGGADASNNYLAKNIKYPQAARDKGIQGTVWVQYIVEADGSISNVEVEKGVSPDLDAEAVRVVSGMPKMKVGMKNGKPVRTQMEQQIRFKLV